MAEIERGRTFGFEVQHISQGSPVESNLLVGEKSPRVLSTIVTGSDAHGH
jgi:hypothetical protein